MPYKIFNKDNKTIQQEIEKISHHLADASVSFSCKPKTQEDKDNLERIVYKNLKKVKDLTYTTFYLSRDGSKHIKDVDYQLWKLEAIQEHYLDFPKGWYNLCKYIIENQLNIIHIDKAAKISKYTQNKLLAATALAFPYSAEYPAFWFNYTINEHKDNLTDFCINVENTTIYSTE